MRFTVSLDEDTKTLSLRFTEGWDIIQWMQSRDEIREALTPLFNQRAHQKDREDATIMANDIQKLSPFRRQKLLEQLKGMKDNG